MKLATDRKTQQLVINNQIADIQAAARQAFNFSRVHKRHPNRPKNNGWSLGNISTVQVDADRKGL